MGRNMMTKLTSIGLIALLAAALLSGCSPAVNNANQANTSNANGNANKPVSPTPRASCDDEAIEKEIGTRIKAKYPEELIKQINWESINCVVTFEGYVELPKDSNLQTYERRKEIIQLAWTTSLDIRDVNGDNLERYKSQFPQPPACTLPDWEECGDICVRAGTCNNGYRRSTPSPNPTP